MVISLNLFNKVTEKDNLIHQRITDFELGVIPKKEVTYLPILADIVLFVNFTHKKTQVDDRLGF
jgi:hypothetical protein